MADGTNRGLGRNVSARAAIAVVTSLLLAGCCKRGVDVPARAKPGPKPVGPASVWVVDDGERIASRAGLTPLMKGEGNAVWSPGEPVKLIGLAGETVAMQVIVTAGSEALSGVEVKVLPFEAEAAPPGKPDTAALGPSVAKYVVHELAMPRRSGGRNPAESLGWALGAMPPDPSMDERVPDPLIPVQAAPSWADYPMTVPAGEHRGVWVDITLPGEGMKPGTQVGEVVVTRGAGERLAAIPMELRVGKAVLPYAAVRTMVYLDPEEVVGRTAEPMALSRAFQVLHAHHLSAVFPINSLSDVRERREVLTGELYTPERGYAGPGQGTGADVVAIGSYGDLGMPSAEALNRVKEIVRELESLGIRDAPGKTDVFVYAADESCDADAGAGWRARIRSAGDVHVRVGWTCSESPASQPVDIAMVFASAYDEKSTRAAQDVGKAVWIYNGSLPFTGAFLTDSYTLSLRANAWIQALYGIERWFYWESTFWNDDNRGGKGRYDPLLSAETFHNQHGDYCNGDGVLMYPGKQTGGAFRDAGWPGVFPSIRMKQWRRGIQDAGYLELARRVDRNRADSVARELLGPVLREAQGQSKPGWPAAGLPWFEARRRLFEMIEGGGG